MSELTEAEHARLIEYRMNPVPLRWPRCGCWLNATKVNASAIYFCVITLPGEISSEPCSYHRSTFKQYKIRYRLLLRLLSMQ